MTSCKSGICELDLTGNYVCKKNNQDLLELPNENCTLSGLTFACAKIYWKSTYAYYRCANKDICNSKFLFKTGSIIDSLNANVNSQTICCETNNCNKSTQINNNYKLLIINLLLIYFIG